MLELVELREGLSNPRIVETNLGVYTFQVDVEPTILVPEDIQEYLQQKGSEYLEEKLGYKIKKYDFVINEWRKNHG